MEHEGIRSHTLLDLFFRKVARKKSKRKEKPKLSAINFHVDYKKNFINICYDFCKIFSRFYDSLNNKTSCVGRWGAGSAKTMKYFISWSKKSEFNFPFGTFFVYVSLSNNKLSFIIITRKISLPLFISS